MDFNYSYRAFLIASLLVGNLVLMFNLIKISKVYEPEEEMVDLEYVSEDILLEEEDIAAVTPKEMNIETHRAFNEAEKFIKELENAREDVSEETESKLAEMNDAIENGNTPYDIPEVDTDEYMEGSKDVSKIIKKSKSGLNRNSTNSYNLVDRTALFFPNPVYTCDSYGKVVISIKVSATGKVIKANYSKAGSTTTNQCLIDKALEYAYLSRFNTASSKPEQEGTITYNFPGQR